ncbi:phage portal protein [Rhodococcus fascians]|nr:phage portal protein [Rhodococcus fascians]MBY4396903.1 phage portal protein [Rhodococcus fascians]MBY4407382.1 phage portal protein [Rhodococcus fascians]MBY4421489.1 phage portal protein [Rhodococcus fascians]MBY4460758.1 phage portal protein [Rhodococcus fascians]
MAELPEDQKAIFTTLSDELTAAQPTFDLLDGYYDGLQRLEQLGLAIPPELLKFTVVVNWPRVVADALNERLDPKGFRLPAADSEASDALWNLWLRARMGEQDMLSRLDYQIYGRTYKCVGTNEADPTTPLITVESPRNVITKRNERTGLVEAGLRMYDIVNGQPTAATLYLPNETIFLTSNGGSWNVDDTDQHGIGVVPVVPAFRRRRSQIPAGRLLQGVSVMQDVIPMTDSAARVITNAQVAQETHAVPQRYALGVSQGDFADQNGEPLPVWEAYFGSVWALTNKDAKVGNLQSSDMANFQRMVELYARMASGVSALPPNYFGLSADDAASADAIRSRESRLVKSAEIDQKTLGYSDAETMRIVMKFIDGPDADPLDGLETLWYDAGTPTVAQRADAVVKKYTATDAQGRTLLPAEAAWEELGYSPTQIARLKQMRLEEAQDPQLERLITAQTA